MHRSEPRGGHQLFLGSVLPMGACLESMFVSSEVITTIDKACFITGLKPLLHEEIARCDHVPEVENS